MHSWFEPIALWSVVERQLARHPSAALRQVLGTLVLGATGVAGAVWVGTTYFNTRWNADLGFLPGDAALFDPFRTTLLGFTLAPLTLALMYLLLAPMFRQPRRPLASLAVAVVGALPIYAAGLLLVALPAVLLLFAAFILSCFWWSAGVRQILGVAGSDATELNVLALLGSGVLLQFGGALLVNLLT